MFGSTGTPWGGWPVWAPLAVACAAAVLTPSAQAARLALVIGNAAYPDSPLKNPVNDAQDMASKLTSLGFQVEKVENLRKSQIGRTLSGFASRIRPGDEVVVFYAGHGLQVKGVNYLPAVDADIQTEDDVPLNSLSVNALMDRLEEAKAGVKLVFLDACRNNPYARAFRSASRGLARVEGAPSGTLILFATRPGSVAADGTGRNGLYTSQLLRFMGTPGLNVESMHKKVAAEVETASRGAQEPWTEGSLKGDFYFNSVVIQPPAPPVDAEQQAWEAAQRLNTLRAYEAYLSQYPQGKFAPAARVMVAGLSPAPTPTPTSVPVPPAPRPAPMPTPTPAPAPAVPVQGQMVQECVSGVCFEMVGIPTGTFQMGSPDTEKDRDSDEGPVHTVNVKGFWMGKTEVTQGLWKAVMGSNPSHFSSCGDTCPVEKVSWDDAQEFIKKLNGLTGKKYRLPSEAEWEYAARAGTRTEFSTGRKIEPTQANFDGNYTYNGSSKGDYKKNTVAVCSYSANPWGLCDMHGNVREWIQDVYVNSYNGAPNDGSAREVNSVVARVLRDGSWYYFPQNLRSANRDWVAPDNRYNFLGLRLARTN